MTSLTEVSKAVRGRIRPVLPDWNVHWFKPAPPPVPSICIVPDPNKYVDYQSVAGSYAQWSFRIEMYTTANDRPAAYELLGSLTDPCGPLLQALSSDEIRDDLWNLCGLNVAVTDGKSWRLRGGRAPYLMADIGLQVGAN